MERIFGALALVVLVAVPFWFSRRKKMKRTEDWNNERETVAQGGITADVSATISGDGGHH
jgi:FtsZ-interacting cell division protein ZipA